MSRLAAGEAKSTCVKCGQMIMRFHPDGLWVGSLQSGGSYACGPSALHQPQQECGACGAEAGEECAPLCLGVATAQDEAGHDTALVPAGKYPQLVTAVCVCGWHSTGAARPFLVERWAEQHVEDAR